MPIGGMALTRTWLHGAGRVISSGAAGSMARWAGSGGSLVGSNVRRFQCQNQALPLALSKSISRPTR